MKNFLKTLVYSIFLELFNIIKIVLLAFRDFLIFIIPIIVKDLRKFFKFLRPYLIIIFEILYFLFSIIEAILKVVTFPLRVIIYIVAMLLNLAWSSVWFYLLLFLINPYIYLNKNYQIKNKFILFLKYSWRSFVQHIYVHVKYLYLTVFYANYASFYVNYLWRPRNFILNLTLGPFLRLLEQLVDFIIHSTQIIFYGYVRYKSLFFIKFHKKRHKIVRKLRPPGKGWYYMRLVATRYTINTALFFFFIWYSLYFLHINSVEIGQWWDSWSVPSFCFFFCIYWYYFFFYTLRRWKRYFNPFFKKNEELFWIVLGSSWAQAQGAKIPSWGLPPWEWLQTFLCFWF